MPENTIDKNNKLICPVLPLRNMVMTPNIITPLLVGRKASIEAVEKAYLGDKQILCVAQKIDFESDQEPKSSNLYRMGTLCTILQIFRLPDNNIRLLVEGSDRVSVVRYVKKRSYLAASIKIDNKKIESPNVENEALYRSCRKVFLEYLRLNKHVPEEAIVSINEIKKPEEFFYFVLANTQAEVKLKQHFLEIDTLEKSIRLIISYINDEIEILKLESRIDDKVKKKLTKLQRDYYLTEQLKIIQRELGIGSDEKEDLLDFKKKISELNLNEEARAKAEEEFRRLSRITHHSQEYTVIHSYLNWILDLPWDEPSVSGKISLHEAKRILDRDHYGLKKVKEHILEFLAVIRIADKMKGQIICFVGPPGVGKTSLGKSIAQATGRKFVRLSLGGVRDEAEIRGHRRTYVGALPGVIIQSMKRAGTKNPLIMMDEIDKMSKDFRGDPASALLEVLDPEQNFSFRDHYLDFGYDLSKVMFITTANSLSSIPQPLMDRMELIRLPGYTTIDKYHIAKEHLIPKMMKEYQLEGKLNITFPKETIEQIVQSYTREAGVRDLERNISKVLRRTIKEYIETLEPEEADNKRDSVKITPKMRERMKISTNILQEYLGPPRHLYSEVNRKDNIGVVTGLAWTMYGGETLQIETIKMKGSGKIKLTGMLGQTMQESAQAAHSYARNHYHEFAIDENFHKETDLHLHIPEGAIPKDGPSAGIGIVTSFISILSELPVRADTAMTGEITLYGKVLPIGGLEEKLIAAKRSGIKNVIIPAKNEPELSVISDDVKKGMNIIRAETLEEVLSFALIKKDI
jgi:ATP-dependent Lon protease